MELGKDASVHINQELLKAYVKAAQELRKQMGAKTELDTVALLRLPGVITALARGNIKPRSVVSPCRLGPSDQIGRETNLGSLLWNVSELF
jgi:Endoribonuclease YicC-like, N-terminal region